MKILERRYFYFLCIVLMRKVGSCNFYWVEAPAYIMQRAMQIA